MGVTAAVDFFDFLGLFGFAGGVVVVGCEFSLFKADFALRRVGGIAEWDTKKDENEPL
jgi:hypothetical protein